MERYRIIANVKELLHNVSELCDVPCLVKTGKKRKYLKPYLERC